MKTIGKILMFMCLFLVVYYVFVDKTENNKGKQAVNAVIEATSEPIEKFFK